MHDEHGKWMSRDEVKAALWRIAWHERDGAKADDKDYFLVAAWRRAVAFVEMGA